jgi:hypothetical protein
MRQDVSVDIRQLGWLWRYAERNRCSEIAKYCFFTTEVSIRPALILKIKHIQIGGVTPIRRTCYNVITYQFRYVKNRSKFQLKREFIRHRLLFSLYKNMWIPHKSNKDQCIYTSCVPPRLSNNPNKAVILQSEATASKYVSKYQTIRMAMEVSRVQLLQVSSEVVHLDD